MERKSNYEIIETTNYEKFKRMIGNRYVSPSRLNAIKESILRIGYQPSPILVNEKMEIIDGGGRLAACEALGLPVYYIIKKGLTINDCISMNMKMQPWHDVDYLNCYAERKYPAYMALKRDCTDFPRLTWREIVVIKGLGLTSGASIDNFRSGKLQYTSLDYHGRDCADWVSRCIPYIKQAGMSKNKAVNTLTRLYRYGLIDTERMLDSLIKYGEKYRSGGYRSTDILNSLNEIYNFNRKNVVYFADEYRQIAEKAKQAQLKGVKKGA